MLTPPTSPTPFEWITTHIQLVGWGTVLSVIAWAVRSYFKAKTEIQVVHGQVKEVHKAITNDLVHSLQRLVELAEKQDRRWESWMMGKAMQGDRPAHDVVVLAAHESVAAAPADNESTEA